MVQFAVPVAYARKQYTVVGDPQIEQAVDKQACLSMAVTHTQWAHMVLRVLSFQADIWVGWICRCLSLLLKLMINLTQ